MNMDDYTKDQLKEIEKGKQAGVDVSIYKDPGFLAIQMRQIRIGLEKHLAVQWYAKKEYDWFQMEEIRLGLEERLPVSKYCSLMYSARTMNQMRQKLLNQRVSRIETGRSHMDEVACDGFTLLISRDQMEVAIATDGKEKQITYEEVQKELEEYGICYGLDATIQQRFPLINTKPENLVAARGRRPVDGEDGWYEYFIDRDVKKTPIVLEDGSVDYQNAIQAYYIGSDKGIITNLKLGSSPQYSKEEASLANREKKVQHELLLLRNAYKEIRSKYPPEVRNQNPIYLKLEDAIYTKEKELEKIINEREAFKKQRNRRRAAKVVVQGRLFTGVCVEINGVIWHSEQVDNITLKNDANTNTIRIYRNGN